MTPLEIKTKLTHPLCTASFASNFSRWMKLRFPETK